MTRFYKKRQFYAMVLPLLTFYLIMYILPVAIDFCYSFTDYRGVGAAPFVALRNYSRLLRDKYIGISIKNTLVTTGVMTLIAVPLSFFIAYTLDRKTKLNEAGKVVVFAPYVIPIALSALVWDFILNPSNGLVNSLLNAVGLGKLAQVWINGPTLSPYSFAVVMVWCSLGFYVSLWQVGIRGIDREIIEASIVDGCSSFQRVRFLILPLLKDTLISIIIFALTGGLKIYEIVYILTGGGPIHKSETIASYMYTVIFDNMEYSYGMAIAVLECLIAIVFVVFFLRSSKKNQKES